MQNKLTCQPVNLLTDLFVMSCDGALCGIRVVAVGWFGGLFHLLFHLLGHGGSRCVGSLLGLVPKHIASAETEQDNAH